MPSVPGKGGKDMVTPVIAELNPFDQSTLKPNKLEVESVFVKTIGELQNPEVCGYTQFRVDGIKGGYTLPVYKTKPYAVWGLTAVITFQFLNVFLKRRPHRFQHKLNYQYPLKF